MTLCVILLFLHLVCSKALQEEPVVKVQVVGGDEAEPAEFPHMALLGYDHDDGTTTWDCGGTIISNMWVMTAAHCTWKADAGDVVKVRVGENFIGDIPAASNVFKVDRIFTHPRYNGRRVYNDIALLRLSRRIKFNVAKSPGCLHAGAIESITSYVTAIGFGLTDPGNLESKSNTLMKVDLESFSYEECSRSVRRSRRLPYGLWGETQVCYGSRRDNKDTCQGDSGSPVQVVNGKEFDCPYNYTVVALTSFGTSCGIKGFPAVYTRIAPYVPWILSHARYAIVSDEIDRQF